MALPRKFECIFILFLFIFLFALNANGADHYVRSGATGLANGEDWENAWPSLPAEFERGDTYFIADGDYGAFVFDTPERLDLYIYIVKATALNHDDGRGWSDDYDKGVARFSGQLTFWDGILVPEWFLGGVQRRDPSV